MDHSFCGSCGLRWDRAARNVSMNNKGKQPAPAGKPDADTGVQKVLCEFVMPSVGLPLQSSGSQSSVVLPLQSGLNINQGSANQAQPPHKSMKAMLHQRANRIGKVEARIAKLQQALQSVQTGWPRPQYVHAVQEMLNKEHTKCVTFSEQATAELQKLHTELHALLHSQIAAECTMPAVTPPYPVDPNPPHVATSQVYAAMEVLQNAGFFKGQLNPLGQQSMEVDSHKEAPDMPVPSPVAPTAPVLPTLPSMQAFPPMGPIGPKEEESDLPPGNWNWPPSLPPAPSLCIPQETKTEEHFPNPLYRPVAPAFVPGTLDPAVEEAVQRAAKGLQEQQVSQGLPSSPLTATNLAQLRAFTEQQKQCHVQLEQLRASFPKTMPVVTSQTAPVPSSTAPVEPHAVSVPSSPGPGSCSQGHVTGPEHFLLSPEGQRLSKVSKTIAGEVHGQPAMAQRTEVPSSAGSPRTPTPVPTEIAEEDTLKQLE